MQAVPPTYHHRHTVRQSEIDSLGHANNVAYVVWMQSAALAHSKELGWPGSRYRELGKGWVARAHKIEYIRPAFAGEEIVVETWVATMKKATSLRRYRIKREADNTLLARAETEWAFINYTTGRSVRIPKEVIGAYSPNSL